MTGPTLDQSLDRGPEATGLVSAIGYTEAVAAAHAAHGANEGFTSSLTAAEYGQAVVDAVAAARHASTDAAAAWTTAAAELGAALTVREAYAAVPDAGDKQHLTADPTHAAPDGTTTMPDDSPGEPGPDGPDTPPARRPVLERLRTGRGVTVTWENGHRVESGTPVEVSYDPDTGAAYEFDADGQPHELRAGQPWAIGAQVLHMHAKIRTDPDHGVTTEQARTLLAGLTTDQLKTVCVEIGYPADSRTRTKKALVDHIVRSSVGSLLDSYALFPHRSRKVHTATDDR